MLSASSTWETWLFIQVSGKTVISFNSFTEMFDGKIMVFISRKSLRLHLNLLMCSYYILSGRRLSPAATLSHLPCFHGAIISVISLGFWLGMGGPMWPHFREGTQRSLLCDLAEWRQQPPFIIILPKRLPSTLWSCLRDPCNFCLC